MEYKQLYLTLFKEAISSRMTILQAITYARNTGKLEGIPKEEIDLLEAQLEQIIFDEDEIIDLRNYRKAADTAKTVGLNVHTKEIANGI